MRRRVWISVCVLGLMIGAILPMRAQNEQAPAQPPPATAPVPPQPADPTQQPPAHGADQPARRRRPPAFPAQQRPLASPEVLARGKTMYSSMCAACHGADARGGQLGGVNLLRSPLVLSDKEGEAVLPVVKTGRPGTGMPAIPISDEDVKAIAAYIHSLQAQGSNQGAPPPGEDVELDVLVGDAAAGAKFFQATCTACHSATDDLAGIASRAEDPKTLQDLWVSGGRAMGGGPGRRAERSPRQIPTVKVTMPGGEIVQGRLVRVDDFLVTVGLDDGTTRTIRRDGDSPAVEITDPMQRHNALLAILTNKNMHDVTAFLATLK
jgi:cytochrome c oxidase cbb3-type subunit III